MPSFTGANMPDLIDGSAVKYPRPKDLIGQLIMLEPLKLEDRPGHNNVGTQETLSANTTVFGGIHTGEYPAMFWTASSIKNRSRPLIDSGKGGRIAGRLTRVASKKLAGKYPTPDTLEAAIAAAAAQGIDFPPTNYVWQLSPMLPGDRERVIGYLDGSQPLTGEADEQAPTDAPDPFTV
jgi:hypothetical protein